MGGALLSGWLEKGLKPAQFAVQEPTPTPMLKKSGVKLIGNGEKIKPPDIVVLAIKPQLAATILPPLADILGRNTLIISLLAGMSIENISQLLDSQILDSKARIIRAMPNTPVSVGAGMTALCAPADVSKKARRQSEALMGMVGKTLWIERESDMDKVTAISGSGPAYLFYLVETLMSSGEALGLCEDVARQLVLQTIIGSALMLDETDRSVRDLRRDVTSPRGTTEAALDVLASEKGGLSDLMRRATQAASQRGRDLAQGGDNGSANSNAKNNPEET